MTETIATPFTLTREGLLDPSRPIVPETDPDWFHGDPNFFQARKPVAIRDHDPETILAEVWDIYQDIGRPTPDGGPDMQMGDLVRLQNNADETWWLILAIGVRKVSTPRWWRLALSPPQRHAVEWLLAHNGLRISPSCEYGDDWPSLRTLRALIRKGVLNREELDNGWRVWVKNVYREL